MNAGEPFAASMLVEEEAAWIFISVITGLSGTGKGASDVVWIPSALKTVDVDVMVVPSG